MSLFYTNETNTLKNHKEKVGDIMTSLKNANRRVGSLFAVAALVLATITPGLIPTFASAAQVSDRSIALSSSSDHATNVSYEIKFTSVGAAKAVVLDFCNDTPLIGASCTAPTGFSVASATVSGGDFAVSSGTASDANTVVATGTVAASTPITIDLGNVTNPDNAGSLYVRILTYTGVDTAAAETAAQAYTSTSNGSPVDTGSAAASITSTVGVSGLVTETMTFCVAGNVINQNNCTTTDNSGTLKAPTLNLGETTGSVKALSTTAVSTGDIYSQLSTNAAGGAVVNLKSGNACGGLMRLTATGCDIVPTTDGSGITAGQAKFGVKVAPGSDPSSPFGTLQIAGAGSAYYSTSVFKLNYDSGNTTGITSPFGDPVLDTDSGPVSNKNATITFGASISPNTPAGTYSNDFSLIATGKY